MPSDVAPARKEDPGELFPWERLAKAGIGLWPQAAASDLEPSSGADALSRLGYDPNAPQDKVITAFQRHFRQERVDGRADHSTIATLRALIEALRGV